MFNFPFSFYKYQKPIILNKDLRDYVKKTNIESFNKFAQVNKLKPCLMNYHNYSSSFLYQRRFETAPRRGAIVQTVTGNLVEVSSAERIEIFNGVNNKISKYEIINEDYICGLDEIEQQHYDDDDDSINYYVKKNILVFIGGTTIIGFLFFYYI